jgi:transcriptional regulator with XRE-family HTH domain
MHRSAVLVVERHTGLSSTRVSSTADHGTVVRGTTGPRIAVNIDRMPKPSPELVRVRFARFVQRSLTAARDRGMTDKDIEAATGVMSSTFHRWRRGDVRTMPGLNKVQAFCDGIGASLEDALAALGTTGERDNPEPDPPMDPDLRLILRRLNDPHVPEPEKVFIRESLRMLADRARRGGEGISRASST